MSEGASVRKIIDGMDYSDTDLLHKQGVRLPRLGALRLTPEEIKIVEGVKNGYC